MMARIRNWIAQWRRSWESAFARPIGWDGKRQRQRGSKYPQVRAHHRRMLLWMILHPFKASSR